MKNLLNKIAAPAEDLSDPIVPSAREMFLGDEGGAGEPAEKEFRFYSSIKLKNGVTKKTSRGRLRELDEWLAPHLRDLPRESALQILDLGISAGMTTVELAEALYKKNLDPPITGVDICISAFLLEINHRSSVLMDGEGNPIHYELDGQGFGYWQGRNLLRRIRINALKRFAFNWLRRYGKRLAELDNAENVGGFMIHPVQLLCRAIRQNPEIFIMEADIFAPDFAERMGDKFELVRAANLLNLAYFSEEKISRAVENIKDVLAPGGLFLAARTDAEDVSTATLFRLDETGDFEVVNRFGAGSEIESLVMR